uniref:Uncharacterized protein n=1 Tax=Micrurus corallinus TaxID=54390 RepID=A0A2D4FS87_MICCO
MIESKTKSESQKWNLDVVVFWSAGLKIPRYPCLTAVIKTQIFQPSLMKQFGHFSFLFLCPTLRCLTSAMLLFLYHLQMKCGFLHVIAVQACRLAYIILEEATQPIN